MFGSTVYVHNKIKSTKLKSKSWKGILVGYVPNGYKIWNPETNTFVNARDVIVDELSYLITRPGITIPDNGKSDGTQIPNNSMSDGIEMPGSSESNELIPDESESEELNVLKTNKSDEMYKRKRKDSNNDNLNYQNKIERCKLNNKQIEMNSNLRRDRFKNKPQISYDDSNTIYDHILYRAVSVANDIPKCF